MNKNFIVLKTASFNLVEAFAVKFSVTVNKYHYVTAFLIF